MVVEVLCYGVTNQAGTRRLVRLKGRMNEPNTKKVLEQKFRSLKGKSLTALSGAAKFQTNTS